MAGKRLAAARLLAAAVAAAAALWLAPHPAFAASHAMRQVHATVDKVGLAHAPAVTATSGIPAGRAALTGVLTATVSLLGLTLLGYAARRRPQAAPAVMRPARRGRAPPRGPMRQHVRTRD